MDKRDRKQKYRQYIQDKVVQPKWSGQYSLEKSLLRNHFVQISTEKIIWTKKSGQTKLRTKKSGQIIAEK